MIIIMKRTMDMNQSMWHIKVKNSLLVERIKMKKAISTYPYKLVYGTKVRFPLSLEFPSFELSQKIEFEGTYQREIRMVDLVQLEENMNSTMIRMEKHHAWTKWWLDRKNKNLKFQAGDMVLKWDPDWDKPSRQLQIWFFLEWTIYYHCL